MAILGNIRNRASNTFVTVMVCFLVIMLLSIPFRAMFTCLFDSHKDQIGTVAGEKISFSDYHKLCATIYHNHNFENKGKKLTAEEEIRLKDYAWNQLIEDMIYAQEIRKVGLSVGASELVDLLQGEHIDAGLMAFFKDPKTGSFDKQKMLAYLDNLSKNEQGRERFCQFQKELAKKRAREKLHQLMFQSYFVTELEEEQAIRRASACCDVDYLYIPFATVSNDLITPSTDQQLQAYMVEHRDHYKASANKRTIQYVTFPIQPDAKDHADFQKELSSLMAQFATATDSYNFAKQHTDGNFADTKLECVADTLPGALAKIKDNLQKGMVFGPVMQGAFHILYKVMAIDKKLQEPFHYQIAVIERKAPISDHARNKCFRSASHFAAQVKNLSDFEALADSEHVTIQTEEIAPSDMSIGTHVAARQVVRWLYNEATVGKISKVFDLGDVYLLAVMTNKVKAGQLLPLPLVFDAVCEKVLNEAKAQIIVDRLKQIQATTLQGIVEQYGDAIEVKSVERLNVVENNHTHLRQAKIFVGQCFGLTIGSISDPIIDNEGVFIACVKNKYMKEIETPGKRAEHVKQVDRWMQSYYVSKSMAELAKITDKRYRWE